MKNLFINLFIITMTVGFVISAKAQSYTFVMIETAVTREDIPTSSENPQERRFYVSNVVEIPDNIRSYQMPELADKYFTGSVVEPLKTKGINHLFYQSDIHMDCGSVLAPKDLQDAEEKRAQCIEDIKIREQVNIYSYKWTSGAETSLETANPTLIFRGKETPNYQPKGEKQISPTVSSTGPATPTSVVKPSAKTKRSKKN